MNSLVSWFGHLCLKNKFLFHQFFTWANKIIGEPQLNLAGLTSCSIRRILF